MPSRKNSPNKHISPNSNFKPESYFDRLILMYDCKSEEGLLKLEEYMLDRQAIIKHRPYVAIKKSMEKKLRNTANEYGKVYGRFSLRKVILRQDPEDVEALKKQNPLIVTDRLVFERRKEGWLYLYFCSDDCLYVGQTQDAYPLHRATAHLVRESHSPWGEYVLSHQHEYQDWCIKFIRPSDCEKLIRKSFFLSDEKNADELMQSMEEEYQERKRTDLKWWLDRAELVLITVFHPRYNSVGNLSQDRE